MSGRKRVFVSFRDVQPDRAVAEAIVAEAERSHDVFFSPNLPPAADWAAAIQDALDTADVFIVVVSQAVLSGGEMVRGEVEVVVQRRRRSREPLILPVQLEGVTLPYPWNAYLNRSQAVHWHGDQDTPTLIEGVRRVLGGSDGRHSTSARTLERLDRLFSGFGRREKARTAMLERVRHDWIEGVLQKSLVAMARIEVRLSELPSATRRLVTCSDGLAERADPVPPGTPLRELFDGHLGQLLILGIPGVGKTTMILELARDLLAWTEADSGRPIPVILNLSSWQRHHVRFDDWLIEELNRSYDVPRGVAREWVDTDALILLLDGLDEVGSELRDRLVAALNVFREECGTTPFVVSSRLAEYQSLSSRVRVRTAVVVQPLDRQDVEAFLAGSGQVQDTLREALTRDPALWEIVDTPLMLSIVAIATQDGMGASASDLGIEDRRRELLERYVETVLARRGALLPYSREKVLAWLSWLAVRMQELGRSVFHLEDLSRDWLPRAADRKILWFAMTCGIWLALPVAWNWEWFLRGHLRADMASVRALLAGAAAFLLYRPTTLPRASWTRLREGLAFAAVIWAAAIFTADSGPAEAALVWAGFAGLLGGVSLLLFWKPRGPGLHGPTDSFAWHSKLAVRGGLWAMLPGSVVGSAIGLQPDVLANPEQSFGSPITTALSYAALVSVVAFVLALPFAGWRSTIPEQQPSPNAGVWRSLRNATIVPVAMAMAATLTARWLDPDLTVDWYFLIVGAAALLALLRGGQFCLQHLIVKLLIWTRGDGPWRYGSFLDVAAHLLILRRVGGGYVFVHRIVLDYFASCRPAAPPSRAARDQEERSVEVA